MPSLHVVWAMWCTAALLPAMRRRWTKVAAIAYPVMTTIAVIATANHFLLDTIAGGVLGLLALVIAARLSRRDAGGAGRRLALVGAGHPPSRI
jgi:hypothetical protein